MKRTTLWIVIFSVLAAPALAQGEQSDLDKELKDLGVEVEYATENNPDSADDAPAEGTDATGEQIADAPNGSNQPLNKTSDEARTSFKGVVIEKGTRKPVADTVIYLQDTPHTATTGANGSFRFDNLPPGKYIVIIPTTGYMKYQTYETIRDNEQVSVKYYLTPRRSNGLEVIVRDKKVDKEVSRTVLEMKEAELVPGTSGDALKAVESMPGVGRGGISEGGLVIRGSNAEDSKFYVDGHEIYSLFHLGGLKSSYNAALIDSFELYTGGFDASHGLATGGVVDVKTRAPRTDRWGGKIDLSGIDGSMLFEGPVGEKSSLAFAARRSTTDLVLSAIDLNSKIDDFGFSQYPAYWDYQAKWNIQANSRHRLAFDAYGSGDKMGLKIDVVDDTDPDMTGEMAFEWQNYNFFFHDWYQNGRVKNHFSPGIYLMRERNSINSDYFNGDYLIIDIRDDLSLQLSKSHNLIIGTQITPRFIDMDANLVQPPKEGDVSWTWAEQEKIRTHRKDADIISSAWIKDEVTIGKFTIVPGMRFDHETKSNAASIAPRMSMRYNIVKPLTLKAAGGLYYKVPEFDEIDKSFGNPNLGMERAVHGVGGLEWQISDNIDLDVQGYYKYLDQQVVQPGNPDGTPGEYENTGKGYVVGGELMLRHNWSNNFFGWISYSISKSMRDDGPGTTYRPFDMDQRHNLIAVASYKLPREWRVGARFQLTSGEPYTDITDSIYNGDSGTYVPVYDKKNTANMGMYHRLDIRIDKRWLFQNWILTAYLDVQNVYLHKNPLGVTRNYDYSETAEFTGLPILPSLGVSAEF